MKMDEALLRCQSCSTVNRVPQEKITLKPKCGKCKTPLQIPLEPIDITRRTFQDEVLSHPGIVLVDFWSPACGHCQNLNPVLNQLASEQAGLIKIAKVNTQTEHELALTFGVRAIPVLILYRNGKKLNEITGEMPKDQLKAWIDSSVTS